VEKDLIFAAGMDGRVADEVFIHASLDHECILPLYQFFEDERHVYMIMELCEQGELFKYIQKRRKPLSEAEARGVLTQVVRGLQHLHLQGIIHRDLKLSNLLLTDNLDVRIGDFGLAVTVNDYGEQQTMCGTPNYISPEIVLRQPYGLASDLWSLGCLIATCLTGKPPFESKQVKNTLDKVSRASYDLPSSLSMEAQDLIRSLLQKDPRLRPPLSAVLDHAFFHASSQKLSMAVGQMGEVLNTARLKPIKQDTRHGSIEITRDGQVVLQLFGESVMCISPDGLHVSQGGYSFQQNRLSESDAKKYRYAKRFVDLVKSKTPLLVYHTNLCKCMLMVNGNVHVQFADGAKILFIDDLVEITPVGEGSQRFPIHSAPSSPHLSEADTLRRQCLELQSSGELNNAPEYPVVLSNELDGSGSGGRALSVCSFGSLHPSNLSSYSRLTEQSRTASMNSGGKSLDRTRPKLDFMQQARFHPKIGWSMQAHDSTWTLVMFHDGCLLKVDAVRQLLTLQEGGKVIEYPISRDLPSHVRSRLRDFVIVSKLFY
jgi:serine/threonine protein kinase